jgi:hypothetical protein
MRHVRINGAEPEFQRIYYEDVVMDFDQMRGCAPSDELKKTIGRKTIELVLGTSKVVIFVNGDLDVRMDNNRTPFVVETIKFGQTRRLKIGGLQPFYITAVN